MEKRCEEGLLGPWSGDGDSGLIYQGEERGVGNRFGEVKDGSSRQSIHSTNMN